MENDQNKMNNNPQNDPSVDNTSNYVRIDDATSDNDATTRLAQPVGESYEGATYVRADQAHTEDATYAATHSDVGATGEAASEAEHVEAEQVGLVPPQPPTGDHKPSGKTRRLKHGNSTKVVAALLIGAIVGGVAGGIAGSQVGGGKNSVIHTVTSERNTDDITYDESGNMTVSSIAKEASPAVVSVYNMTTAQPGLFGYSQNTDGESTAQGYGSGVIISEDGLIVTNYHVIEGADSVVITTSDGTQYDASVLGADSNLDLALLKIDASDLAYVSFADSDQVQVGDMAVAVGNPLGSEFANTVTDGIISGVDRKISDETGSGSDIGYLQTNAAINNGNSGGALLNGQAELIGINSLKVSGSGSSSMANVEGMGFAIPSNTVLEFVNSVKDGETTNTSTKKAWVGISGYTLDEDVAQQVGVDQTSGILVASVTNGGPAYNAGIRMGDVITGVDGSEIKSFEDLSNYLAKKAPGDTITLTINSGGQSKDVTVTLAEEQQ